MSHKLTLEEFKNKANEVHNFKYDYSKSIYIDSKTKLTIVCLIHGEFLQSPNSHLNSKYPCYKCLNEKRSINNTITQDEFVNRSNIKHNNFYDYSKSVYKSMREKIIIICKEHGEFLQTPDSHIRGCGCPECGKIKITIKNSSVTNGIKECACCHKQKNISEFHKRKRGSGVGSYCKECSSIKSKQNKMKDLEKHKQRSKIGFKKWYDKNKDYFKKSEIKDYYDEWKNNNKENLKKYKVNYYQENKEHILKRSSIRYRESHPVFLERVISLGENIIKNWLNSLNIKFETQKRFENCKYKRSLPFDFYLPDFNLCIEYDGELHFKENDFFGGENHLKITQKRDKIKTDFCKDNDIKLIRIPYWNIDFIEIILETEIFYCFL